MKTFSIIFISLLTLTSCLKDDNWYLLQSEEFGFSVEFPSKPMLSNAIKEFEFGEIEFNFYLYDAQNTDDENYLYLAGHIELPDSIVKKQSTEEFFKSAIENAVSQNQSKIISTKVISCSGYPGREVKFDYKNGDSIITLRVYLVNNEEFLIETMTKPDKEYNKSQERFFNSFEITKPL